MPGSRQSSLGEGVLQFLVFCPRWSLQNKAGPHGANWYLLHRCIFCIFASVNLQLLIMNVEVLDRTSLSDLRAAGDQT